MNPFELPAPLVFGEFNKQLLVEMQVKRFAMSIGSTNVCPFAQNNMLPLVILKDNVEVECGEGTVPEVEGRGGWGRTIWAEVCRRAASSPGDGDTVSKVEGSGDRTAKQIDRRVEGIVGDGSWWEEAWEVSGED